MFCSEMLILKKMQIHVTKARSYLHDEPDMGVQGAGVSIYLRNSFYAWKRTWPSYSQLLVLFKFFRYALPLPAHVEGQH